MVTARTGSGKSPGRGLDGLDAVFDDERAVANAGLLLPATLAERLGLEALCDQTVKLGTRPGAARPGRKVLSIVAAMLLGADSIDDCAILRTGQTEAVLGHRAMAPSTIGTFLRSFSFGHVRQLDRMSELALTRAWAAGAGPGEEPMTIDIDSTICQVHGYQKQGAAYGHTRTLGYHPVLATRADTGEVLHLRQRTGRANTARGAERFVNELAGRVRRAGATGTLTLRADSGFWSAKVIGACQRHQIRFSITVRSTEPVRTAIATIPEAAWQEIPYTKGGVAQVAETAHQGHRLIVRRTRIEDEQIELVPSWRYHAFLTDRPGEAVPLDADHRAHAVCELAIRDIKAEGLAHTPSGRFGANSAWLVIAGLAHNLVRWLAAIGLATSGPLVAETVRRRLLCLPGRITRSGRRTRLHLPHSWPWQEGFLAALARLRALCAP